MKISLLHKNQSYRKEKRNAVKLRETPSNLDKPRSNFEKHRETVKKKKKRRQTLKNTIKRSQTRLLSQFNSPTVWEFR